jgi:hypothetical protein
MSIRSIYSLALIAAAVALPIGGGEAAPQVLGLIASKGAATPLKCDGVECGAHFSSFCLQEAREPPTGGHPYTVAEGGAVTLILSMAEGSTVRLPAEQYVGFSTLFGFTSVRIAMPAARLHELGAISAAVEVGPAVALIPQAFAGDADPQTADEIAVAAGPLRQAAARWLESPGAFPDAARVTSTLINALPQSAAEADAVGDRLWRDHVSAELLASLTAEGQAAAWNVYDDCRNSDRSGAMLLMRSCLSLRHADLMASTNRKFWREFGGY